MTINEMFEEAKSISREMDEQGPTPLLVNRLRPLKVSTSPPVAYVAWRALHKHANDTKPPNYAQYYTKAFVTDRKSYHGIAMGHEADQLALLVPELDSAQLREMVPVLSAMQDDPVEHIRKRAEECLLYAFSSSDKETGVAAGYVLGGMFAVRAFFKKIFG